jgi:uncharacterized protein (DUF433 family)
MRIAVDNVLGWLASGMTEQKILSAFPEVAVEDIGACLAIAADRERGVVVVTAER